MTTFYNCKKVVFLLLLSFLEALCAADPTDGFTRVSLAAQNLNLQIPYDKSPADRYSKVDGVERFWVYTNDKPFKQGSPTRPRTEIHLHFKTSVDCIVDRSFHAPGYDYTSGVWQFEGNFYAPPGSSGVIIMQIHGAATEATTLQLRVYNGDLKYYGNNVVASNIYDKWLRLNVIHNFGAGKVTIFIDGKQKLVVNAHGRANFYFKYGVYGALSASSNYMESRWKEVKLLKK
ncbi:citrate-binding protein [Prunus yedoensis var. nudiflora]|uniref:Citrate-binding protein n=1 Tax=Prunus yedoensis var. nudiflora TaxID=2094558 RepID=A0A314Y7K3_PRUYE|nr:citrate-binding protein [Prunus yedoensis var. nudiflora]